MSIREKYVGTGVVSTDFNGLPAAIVAVHNGEPLVLMVSPETMEAFEEAREHLSITHVELANRLRDSVWAHSGEFHENSVVGLLRSAAFRGA